MKVTTDLRVGDIVAINVRNYFANRARYAMSVVVAVAYAFYLLNDIGAPVDQRGWIILAAGGVVFAVACFFLFLGVGVLNAVSMVKNHRGVIGVHEMELSPQGLRDGTEFFQSFTRWPAVARITRRGSYLSFWVSPYLAHIVPERAFADAAGFDAFERLARAYHAGEEVEAAPRAADTPVLAYTDPSLWKRPAA